MSGEYSAHNILVEFQAIGQVDLLGNAGQPYRGLRFFISTMASMTSLLDPLGPGFLPPRGEYSSQYFRFFSAL